MNDDDEQKMLFEFRRPFEDPQFKEKTAKVVNAVFNALMSIFPAWQSMGTNTDSMKKTWIDAFMLHNICSSEQITIGLEKCVESESPFFPSVGQFITWCSDPASVGLPSITDAYNEAIREAHMTSSKKWSHPEIKEAVKQIGNHFFTHMTAQQSRNAFETAYRKVIADKIKGKKFEPLPELENKANQRKEHIARDYKSWIEEKPKSESFSYEDLPINELIGTVTIEQKKNWKPGDVLPQYAHLTSAEKALPVIYKILDVWNKKQEEAKKIMKG